MSNQVYGYITDKIMEELERGCVPWHKPWKGVNQWPQNFISRKVYRGINLFLLNSVGYASPFWLTFKSLQKGKKDPF
jgi:antirestriction protein ArdC